MPCLPRIVEGHEVDENVLTVFSRVARWSGFAAAKRIQKILGSRLSNGMKVLDIGTGPASIPLYLKRFFPDVSFTGIDLSIGMLGKAQENRIILDEEINLLSGNGEILPFRLNSLDVVTSFFALHHMDRPEHLFNEVDRVLKPDGVFLVIDFRRDMNKGLYHILNTLWQGLFFFTSGRFGVRDSIQASWSTVEIESILVKHGFNGFNVHVNPIELWIYKGLK